LRKKITIRLPEQVKNELDRIVILEHASRSIVVSEAQRRSFAKREFQRLRGLMTAEAEKRGIFTYEDVLQ